MIEVKDLTKKYDSKTAVNHLNFTIESGKIYGFLGPNGAGKSTTMNMIAGCLASTDGTVLIDGHDIFEEPITAKKMIGYLPEHPPLYQDMTPFEYLRFVARAKGVERAKVDDEVEAVMDETGVTGVAQRLIKNLSKGYKQRVGIAQALLGSPKLIILDEPTVGLDPKQIVEIRDLIRNLGESRTVMISSHILAEISEICDHVMIINHGNLVASDTIENIKAQFVEKTRVLMTVKADMNKVSELLKSIDGVVGFEITPSEEANGYLELSVETDGKEDIRELLTAKFVEAGVGVRRITVNAPSLEEIFIKLTSDISEESEYDEDDDWDGEENEDVKEGEDEDDTEQDAENEAENKAGSDASGKGKKEEARTKKGKTKISEPEEDDYTPLFGGNNEGKEEDM